ncbi:MAG: aminoacyl-tRNA hydrolase [Candidatus Thioglobus sp.]|uniref:aminoacyl-tRNA hydrolase n=1 Tax=Candidatus Thioglobus sp. TaxID=2026721 RepID=UPI00263320FE|nr:aminoacyl-tRNA hydrolase [Candidatus Thioglobus sp.]MDC9726801.1 aminoacyl-tRNA hydrolase [Candidatus Thioglobus sp.]
MAIKLIVGLGNPGKDYQSHRHNVGFWFCDAIASLYSGTFKKETKFLGEVTQVTIAEKSVRLLKPTTFMNRSGQSIQALAKFYQLNVDEILVVHDELDLDVGMAKLKTEGGHGGHNGLRDTIKALGSKSFHRLRLGIGHPGNKAQVADYVLHAPNKSELEPIQSAMIDALQVIEDVVQGNIDKAMKNLHTKA